MARWYAGQIFIFCVFPVACTSCDVGCDFINNTSIVTKRGSSNEFNISCPRDCSSLRWRYTRPTCPLDNDLIFWKSFMWWEYSDIVQEGPEGQWLEISDVGRLPQGLFRCFCDGEDEPSSVYYKLTPAISLFINGSRVIGDWNPKTPYQHGDNLEVTCNAPSSHDGFPVSIEVSNITVCEGATFTLTGSTDRRHTATDTTSTTEESKASLSPGAASIYPRAKKHCISQQGTSLVYSLTTDATITCFVNVSLCSTAEIASTSVILHLKDSTDTTFSNNGTSTIPDLPTVDSPTSHPKIILATESGIAVHLLDSIYIVVAIGAATLVVLALAGCGVYKMTKDRRTVIIDTSHEANLAEEIYHDPKDLQMGALDQANCKSSTNETPSRYRKEDVKLEARLPGDGTIAYWTATTTNTPDATFIVKSLSQKARMTDQTSFRRQATQLLKLKEHQNIVKIWGIAVNDVPYYVFMEYLECGSLRDYLLRSYQSKRESNDTSNAKLPASMEADKLGLIYFALDIANAMSYLSNNNYCHPGLSASKVLLTTKAQCKLYDFVPDDIAQSKVNEIFDKKNVPFAWFPPETIFLRQYNEKADIWSFGIMLWEIYSLGEYPYLGLTGEEIETEIREKRCLAQPLYCPGAVFGMMLSAWDLAPQGRPSFHQLLDRLDSVYATLKEEMQPTALEPETYFTQQKPASKDDYI